MVDEYLDDDVLDAFRLEWLNNSFSVEEDSMVLRYDLELTKASRRDDIDGLN